MLAPSKATLEEAFDASRGVGVACSGNMLRQERVDHPALFVGVIVRRTHPDKVALHRAPRILQHAAKFPAVVQDEEVDVELLRRTLVVSDLTSAVRVNNGLPFIDCRNYGTVETLRSVTFEKTIRIAGTGPQQ